MIKLFSMKNQKKDGSDAPKQGTQKRASAAQLRITKGGKRVTRGHYGCTTEPNHNIL